MPRFLQFHAALADIRASSRPAAPVYVVGGRYNLPAIMREAVRVARSLRAGGASWAWRMAIGLRTVWGRAQAARAAAATLPASKPHTPASNSLSPRSRLSGRARVRVFDRGSRVFSHGW